MFLDIQDKNPVLFVDKEEIDTFQHITQTTDKMELWSLVVENFANPLVNCLKHFGVPSLDTNVRVFCPEGLTCNQEDIPSVFCISGEGIDICDPGPVRAFLISFKTMKDAIEGAWCLNKHMQINKNVSITSSALFKDPDNSILKLYGTARLSIEGDMESAMRLSNVFNGISCEEPVYGDIPMPVLLPGPPASVVIQMLNDFMSKQFIFSHESPMIEYNAIEKLSEVENISKQ